MSKTINHSNLKSLDQFVDEQYGKRGTKKREAFEQGFEAFKIGFLTQQARLDKGIDTRRVCRKGGN
ncbi:MAG TPA: hypothetical protein PKN22_07610 [Taishania sp.]|nr:hypothetical protein [Taishania sp.]HNS42609.1 hypothetical protein [Taishania sp.]